MGSAGEFAIFPEEAFRVGKPEMLVERRRAITPPDEGVGAGTAQIELPTSGIPRGLSLTSLSVSRNWDGLWGLLGRRQQIYFLTVALDLSGTAPVVMPPKEVAESMIYWVTPGERIKFTLGGGAPVFPPRVITGGLLVYIIVCEADKGVRHVGEVMAKVHEDLAEEGSIFEKVIALIKNPAATALDEALSVAAAALQPIATILNNKQDNFIGVFQGIYPAKGPWKGLSEERDGTAIELAELSDA